MWKKRENCGDQKSILPKTRKWEFYFSRSHETEPQSYGAKGQIRFQVFFRFPGEEENLALDFLRHIHGSIGNYRWRWGESPYKKYRGLKNCNGLIKRGNETLIPLRENIYFEWDEDFAEKILQQAIAGGNGFFETPTENSICIDVPSDRLSQLLKKIDIAVKKNPSWKVKKEKDIEKLSFKKKKADFDFDFGFSEEGNDLFSFALDVQLENRGLTLSRLKKAPRIIRTVFGASEWGICRDREQRRDQKTYRDEQKVRQKRKNIHRKTLSGPGSNAF
jgi:hypothetical protein